MTLTDEELNLLTLLAERANGTNVDWCTVFIDWFAVKIIYKYKCNICKNYGDFTFITEHGKQHLKESNLLVFL